MKVKRGSGAGGGTKNHENGTRLVLKGERFAEETKLKCSI